MAAYYSLLLDGMEEKENKIVNPKKNKTERVYLRDSDLLSKMILHFGTQGVHFSITFISVLLSLSRLRLRMSQSMLYSFDLAWRFVQTFSFQVFFYVLVYHLTET
jgi:hypothetical protein